jgi:hypothetical protein
MPWNTTGVALIEMPFDIPSRDLLALLLSNRDHPFKTPDQIIDGNLRRCSPIAWMRRSGGKEPLRSQER